MADVPTLSKRQLEFLEALHKGAKAFLIVTRAGAQVHCVGLGSVILTTFYSLERRGLIDRTESRNPGNWEVSITEAGTRALITPPMSDTQRALVTRMVKEDTHITMLTGLRCSAWITKGMDSVNPGTVLALERMQMVERISNPASHDRFTFAASLLAKEAVG